MQEIFCAVPLFFNALITRAFIVVKAGYKADIFNYYYKNNFGRPLTKAYIDTVVESKTDWLRRRTFAIAQECRMLGKKISIEDVKCEIIFRPNTFVKYENFLKELIDEINK